jgi:hypothetical protein
MVLTSDNEKGEVRIIQVLLLLSGQLDSVILIGTIRKIDESDTF